MKTAIQNSFSSLPGRTRSHLMLLYGVSFVLRMLTVLLLLAMWLTLSMRRTEILLRAYGGLYLVAGVYFGAVVLSFLLLLFSSGLRFGTDKLFLSAAAGGRVRAAILFSPCVFSFSKYSLTLEIALCAFKTLWFSVGLLPFLSLAAVTFILRTDTALSLLVYRVLLMGCVLLLSVTLVFFRTVSSRYSFSHQCLLCGATSVRSAVKIGALLADGQLARSAARTLPEAFMLLLCSLIVPAPYILARRRYFKAAMFVRLLSEKSAMVAPSKTEKPVVLERKFA